MATKSKVVFRHCSLKKKKKKNPVDIELVGWHSSVKALVSTH